MSTPVGMIIKRIASIVVELIKKPKGKSTKNLYCKCWKKIPSCNGISTKWPNEIGHYINYNNQNWSNYEIP